MGVLILIIVALVTAFYFYLRHKMTYWKRLGVPSLSPSYIFGNIDGVGNKIHLATNFQYVYENFKDKHKFCGFYLLQAPRLIIIDLDIVKNILIKDFHNFTDRGVFHADNDPLSNHLFSLEGEKWKNLRNKLSVTFTSGRMKLMHPIIENHAKTFVELIDGLSKSDQGIDIKNVCVRFTADVIGSCGFGVDCNAMENEDTEMMKMAEFFDLKDTLTRINFFVANVFIDFAKALKLSVTPKFITDFFLPMIREIYEYRMKNEVARNDFLSLLIQIKKYGKLKDEEMESVGTLTFDELAAQAFIFFIAGFETSSTTMTMALYELSYRPEIQNKLREEINEVSKRYDGKISYEALAEMQYLDQVVKETLRIYSPIGQIFRKAVNDYNIPGTSLTIEKGTYAIIPVHAIHHDSKYYYDPELFNPDRFAPEEFKKRPKFCFLPFGDGPRNCIGERFGYMQTKIGIATVIKNFELSFHKDTRYPLIMDPTSVVVSSLKPIKLHAVRI